MKKLFFLIALIAISAFTAVAQDATITGRVTFGKSSPLHDVSVQIVQTKQAVRTDQNGVYTLSGVAPGRYTMLVHIEGFSDATRLVTVVPGANLNIDFELEILALKEQVTVTAAGTEQTVFDSFQTVNSVGSTRITEKASTSIGEVLENETGVAKRSFGPGSSRPIIRGFDGDRVLVLQDGVRNGSVGSQSGDHGEPVDPLGAERIEVVKGPGTLLYGSNAIGGVVNVISHHHDDYHAGFRGFFTGVAGTADKQAGASGGVEYGINRWLFRGSLGSQRTGDYQTPIGRIPNSASRSTTGSFGTGYYADKAFINGSFNFDIRRYGVPFAALFEGHGEEEEEFGELPDVDEEIDLRLRRYNYRINGGFRDLTNSFLSGVNYNFDYTNYRHKEIEREDGIDEVGTIFDNKIFSYRSVFEQQRSGKLTGRFGVEGFHRDYEVNGAEQLIDGKVNHNAFSFFALEELNFDRVKFQFGGRVENNRYKAENPELRDRSFTGFSGGAGINVGLWDGGAAIANYTFSTRAPALEELYNNGPHIGTVTFEIGNNDLVKETSHGIDLALRHQTGRVRISGDVFYYRINNFVFFAPQDEDGDGEIDIEDGLPVARYEQEDAEYVGAELSADVRFNRYFGGFVSLDTVRAKLIDSDVNVPRIPPSRARLGLDFRYEGLSLRPEVIFASAQTKVFPLETRTAGYGIFNIAGSYTIGRQHVAHVLSFNAYNLTDKLYRNHSNYLKDLMPEIGRGIRFGYTVRFF
jgi:iron complex outermembrane recepter protein